MKQTSQNSSIRTLIRWLHPMFWVAAGLHGFLLFVPLSSEETIAIPEEAATEPITVTRIPTRPISSDVEAGATASSTGAASSSQPAAGTSGSGTINSRGNPSRPGGGQSNSGGSTNSNDNDGEERDINSEISDLSNENDSNSSDADSSVTPRGIGNGGGTNTVDSLLAYAREISERDQPRVSDALYAYVRALSLAYTYIPVDPSLTEKNREDWIMAVRAQTNHPNLSPEQISEPVTIEYPLITCLRTEPELATVGVIVDVNGNVIPLEAEADEELPDLATMIANPMGIPLPNTATVIKGTGYRGLDHKAIEAVSEQAFENQDEIKAYLYEVQVDYDGDSCVAVPTSSETAGS